MIQLHLFAPPAAPDNPLPEEVRRKAGDLVSDLLIAVIVACSEKQPTREGDSNG